MAGRSTHEQSINYSLGEVLKGLGRKWSIKTEENGVLKEGGRPDNLIEKSDGWPVALEAAVDDKNDAESDARKRLGKHVASNGDRIHAAIAIVYPGKLTEYAHDALREMLTTEEFEYALLTQGADNKIARFPESGWLKGAAADLAVLIHRSSVPAWKVSELSKILEDGINQAEGSFRPSYPHGSEHGKRISAAVGQKDDAKGQARRMAMAIVADALIFHEALHEAGLQISNPKRLVKSPREMKSGAGDFVISKVKDEWKRILDINYHPIFYTAREVLAQMPDKAGANALRLLWEAAEQLTASNVNKSHDLTGVVFQRLIADRQFLATYYTRPPGAALLAGLALPAHTPIAGKAWGDAEALKEARIADFACGTGTLLSTSYQRFSLLHEVNGGNPENLHAFMMEKGIVGLDVLAVAVHLTAAMLASTYPAATFDGECLLTMPYGVEDDIISVGSLELLQGEQMPLEIVQNAATVAGGRGKKEVKNLVSRMSYDEFGLVIMNPPFTRPTSREGEVRNVPNPAFAAFNQTKENQKRLAQHTKNISGGTCGDGNAGLASHFTELGHRKTAPSGMLAMVMPCSALSGSSWEGVRKVWRKNYVNPVVVTIAASGSSKRSFSADTGIAECLFVGRKKTEKSPTGRAYFAVLKAQPSNTIEGEQIAMAISKLIAEGGLRRIENAPSGGTRIMLGDTSYGEIIAADIPEKGAWQSAGFIDITVGQSAYHLGQGLLWIEGMSAGVNVPVCKIKDIGERGLVHRNFYEDTVQGKSKLPRGPFERLDGCSEADAYPALYGHKSVNNESLLTMRRQLVVEPESHCRIREIGGKVPDALSIKANELWQKTAARPHYNLELRFNAQSLVVAMTPAPSLGGSSWAVVKFEDERHEYPFSLWCNSTLGLLCHWWMSNKSQGGRGRCSVETFPEFSTLDVRQLTDAQLSNAEMVFNELSGERFLPFNQINEDKARAELDRRLLEDVLGLSPELRTEMKRLREKMAREPQIHDDKKERVVFTEDGEIKEKPPGEKTAQL